MIAIRKWIARPSTAGTDVIGSMISARALPPIHARGLASRSPLQSSSRTTGCTSSHSGFLSSMIVLLRRTRTPNPGCAGRLPRRQECMDLRCDRRTRGPQYKSVLDDLDAGLGIRSSGALQSVHEPWLELVGVLVTST